MQIQEALKFWQASLVKALACLCLLSFGGWQCATAAEPPLQISTEHLESLMLPPPGWKLNREELREYFWLMPAHLSDEKDDTIVIYPFWPAFIELDLHAELRIGERLSGYHGALGELLANGLNSSDPAVKRRSELWLRHSLILYFTGIRLSTLNGVKPYAPWIKPEDARPLEQLADHFLAGLKPMYCGGLHPAEITHFKLVEWLANPKKDARHFVEN